MLFGPENKFRIFLAYIQSWKHFETISILIILTSTINLSIYNPLNDPDSTLSLFNYYLDLVIVIFFTIEAMLLIVVFGFIKNGQQSYILSGWNFMDFFIVIVSIIGLAIPDASESKVLKTFKLLRLLRPLRLI